MSNVIQIKHGKDKPASGILQPFELGYATSEGLLYIGNSSGNTASLNYLPLSGGTITGDTTFSKAIVGNSTLTIAGISTLNGKIIIGSSNYGETLPSTGTIGELFFKTI